MGEARGSGATASERAPQNTHTHAQMPQNARVPQKEPKKSGNGASEQAVWGEVLVLGARSPSSSSGVVPPLLLSLLLPAVVVVVIGKTEGHKGRRRAALGAGRTPGQLAKQTKGPAASSADGGGSA